MSLNLNDERMVKRIFDRLMEGTRAKGIPKKQWIDCEVEDLEMVDLRDWKTCVRDRQK